MKVCVKMLNDLGTSHGRFIKSSIRLGNGGKIITNKNYNNIKGVMSSKVINIFSTGLKYFFKKPTILSNIYLMNIQFLANSNTRSSI